MESIKVGDLVEEVGTDSGWWVVTKIFRNTPRKELAARVALKDRPNVVTFLPLAWLAKVG